MLLIPGHVKLPVAIDDVRASIATSAMRPSISLLAQSGPSCFLVTRLLRWATHLPMRSASASRLDSTDFWDITFASFIGSDLRLLWR